MRRAAYTRTRAIVLREWAEPELQMQKNLDQRGFEGVVGYRLGSGDQRLTWLVPDGRSVQSVLDSNCSQLFFPSQTLLYLMGSSGEACSSRGHSSPV